MIPNYFYVGKAGGGFYSRPFWNFIRYGLGSWQITTGWLWWCLQFAHDRKLKDLPSIRCPDCGEVGALYFGFWRGDEECVEASCICGGGFVSYDSDLASMVQKLVLQRAAAKGAIHGIGARA